MFCGLNVRLLLVSAGGEVCERTESHSCGPAPSLSTQSDQDRTIPPVDTPATAAVMVSPNNSSNGPDEAVSQSER